jgi:alkylhydroperoxidase/carboxymuconolactone decarboxylase family protein YurZ
MIRWIVNRQMKAFERSFNYDLSYAREIFGASRRAFWHLTRITAAAGFREGVSREACYAAKLAATLSEDCGPCLQLVVTMAEREGVNPATLRAILAADTEAMSDEASLGYHFARAVLARDVAESDRLRAEILKRWGYRGLVSLALAIATSRTFPNIKYALGHGHACTLVHVAGAAAPLARRESRV